MIEMSKCLWWMLNHVFLTFCNLPVLSLPCFLDLILKEPTDPESCPLFSVCIGILASLGESANSTTYFYWFDPRYCFLETLIESLLPNALTDLNLGNTLKMKLSEELLINSCYCVTMLPQTLFSNLVCLSISSILMSYGI